jgi:hypothetical protein
MDISKSMSVEFVLLPSGGGGASALACTAYAYFMASLLAALSSRGVMLGSLFAWEDICELGRQVC